MPDALLHPGPFGLLVWQWLALPSLVIVALLVARLFGRLTRLVQRRMASGRSTVWGDRLVARLRGPMDLLWGAAVVVVGLPLVELSPRAEELARLGLRGVLLAAVFWSALRVVDTFVDVLGATPWAVEHPLARSFLPLGGRLAQIGIVAIGLATLLSYFGFPVASLLAGLGVGGLAVALAAQKTFENLFGAFALGLDQPFRQGDLVKVGDHVGTVEYLGLRSTRIRTEDRTVVSIPNAALSDARVESYAARDRIRLATTIGLVYGTSAAQMRVVLEGIEGVLRAHPRIWPDEVVVRFIGFGASALDVQVVAWFTTTASSEFRAFRQEVLLAIMEVVERAGTSFAFPTGTMHLVRDRVGGA